MTCGICLELVPSYYSASYIRGLSRIFSQRGTPSSILSDIDTILHPQRHNNVIYWNCIPPGTFWWGGLYDRIMRCVKHCLKNVLYRNLVGYKELQTIMRNWNITK